MFEDEDTLQMYVEESLEHLSNIENDLLEIEQSGENIDEEVVNCVFRAAHSIKGGAGFMGLTNIKELSHKIENILGMIRSRELTPNPDIISILLKSFDMLSQLINNVQESNEIDISEYLVSLVGLTSASLPVEEKQSIENTVNVFIPGHKDFFTVSEFDITQAKKEGKFIYIVEYDLIQDIQQKNKTPLEVISSLTSSGVIIETKIDVQAVGTLDASIPPRIPFIILFASIIDPDIISTLFDVDEKYVHLIPDEMITKGERPAESTPDIETVPEPIKEPEIEQPPVPEKKIKEKPKASKPPTPVQKPVTPLKAPVPKPKKVIEIIDDGSEDNNDIEILKTNEPASVDIKQSKPQTSLRVNVSLLDTLMTLAGELVLTRNQLLQAINANNERAQETASQRIDMVTSELQEAIMRTRMQPIANVFNKFPRVVRDLARSLGKEINLEIEGKNVELDKTIIEAINDPLTHLVRNSVDHGIESPNQRSKIGKDPTGLVKLNAFHEAGQVNIEITDDGKGLDGDRLAAKALEKGLVNEQQVRLMSDKEKIGMIFLPGFSTAEQVTDVSGRGVGMDVVKTNLDKLGGIIDIDSMVGKWTRIRIKLPLTLAIIPSQIICVAQERYAIPQVNLNELLRIPAAQIKERVERVGNAEVVRLRGNLLPLLNLSHVLGISKTFIHPENGNEYPDRRAKLADRRSKSSPYFEDNKRKAPADASDSREPDNSGKNSQKEKDNSDLRKTDDRRYHAASALNIAVVSAGTFKYGLVVDQLRDSEEIVVKPLGRHLKTCKGYAGATIMGDGKVALILDVVGLAQMAELTSLEGSDRLTEVSSELMEMEKANQEKVSLLLFKNAVDESFAVPLKLVERIERIQAINIEDIGGKKVIQYRGGTLPLYGIEQVATVKNRPDLKELEVLVFKISGHEFGLMVTPPVDAADVSVHIDSTSLKQPGIMGTSIINNHTTLMVDIFEVIKTLNPDWFDGIEVRQKAAKNKGTILFAEDSNFFRQQVRGFLEDAGFDVIEAIDGLVAWEILEEQYEEIDIVLTDLEMPNMNGFEFTRRIKSSEKYSHLPVIALTSLASEEHVQRGKSVGIDSYEIKLEREKLIDCIVSYLRKE